MPATKKKEKPFRVSDVLLKGVPPKEAVDKLFDLLSLVIGGMTKRQMQQCVMSEGFKDIGTLRDKINRVYAELFGEGKIQYKD